MWVNWNNDGVNDREIYARSGGQGISITTGNNVREETWNHVVYTYTSDTLRMYLNGKIINKQLKNWIGIIHFQDQEIYILALTAQIVTRSLAQLMMSGYTTER